MAEKTEKATPKKLKDAAKKGQVAKAQDLPAAFTFIASVAIILALATFMYHQMADFMVGTFHAVPNQELTTSITSSLLSIHRGDLLGKHSRSWIGHHAWSDC